RRRGAPWCLRRLCRQLKSGRAPSAAALRVSAVDQFRMFGEERSPLVGTVGLPRVSVLPVELGDPAEHALSPVDRGYQRGEEERVPDADDNDRDGAHYRPPECISVECISQWLSLLA